MKTGRWCFVYHLFANIRRLVKTIRCSSTKGVGFSQLSQNHYISTRGDQNVRGK